MYMHICNNACICSTYICTPVHTYTHTHTHTSIYSLIQQTHMCMHTPHTYARIKMLNAHTHTRMLTHIYARTCMHTYTVIYAENTTYMRTRTYTSIQTHTHDTRMHAYTCTRTILLQCFFDTFQMVK